MGVGMAGGEGGQHLGDPNAALLGWGEGPPPSLPLPQGLASFLLFSYPSSLNTHIIYNIGLSLSLSHLSTRLYIFILGHKTPSFLFSVQMGVGGACLPGTSLLEPRGENMGVGMKTGWGDRATGHRRTHPDPAQAGSTHRVRIQPPSPEPGSHLGTKRETE